MAADDNQLPPSGKVPCTECGEPHPVWLVPNGICSGCYALVEIACHMGLRNYRRREEYSHSARDFFAQGEPPGGHATRLPKTGLDHLDYHLATIYLLAERMIGRSRTRWPAESEPEPEEDATSPEDEACDTR